ncbi:MAG: 50S ribosomal protein L19 [Planctomycetes bacterium]|jgi:large subunit ribosomal protein L19|nr:50S ribosomal protein L19 [Planctomycetota bacterium]HNZ66100.1 50S ribosomal protein L19 [Planctomycetota bacterium]HON44232.1 50S ribosomal protein L19 [Planctomycetota bacterium]HPY75284.1 50S ribosomal protein L19 [Planctomycetota bacterium]HQB00941.1 50S ribosomal protein L19 [Planctomycetota bacterium]
MNKLDAYSKKFQKEVLPEFEVGDTVDVIIKITEGNKERKQTFNGIVIAMRGEGLNSMFTVRRIVQGEGVERVFPLHSPKVVTVVVKKKGKTRRAKLYYLRDRVGKATKLKEKIWDAASARRSAKLSAEAAQWLEAKAAEEAAEK